MLGKGGEVRLGHVGLGAVLVGGNGLTMMCIFAGVLESSSLEHDGLVSERWSCNWVAVAVGRRERETTNSALSALVTS
jgi:hypothetical protein